MSTESKLKVHARQYDPINDEIVTKKKLKNKFVSDGIGEDFKTWTAQTPIMISAQTGMGKNTFIENVLLNFISEIQSKILIISNRIANNRQQKERIANLFECSHYLEDLTPKGLDKVEIFNNVRIVTYQKLSSYLDNIFELKQIRDCYDIVVFDEVHFFMSDSLFNNQTGNILGNSLLAFKNSIRVYMSATPEEIFPIIIKKEKALRDVPSNSFSFINYGDKALIKPKEILLYDFKRDYTYVYPKYFYCKEEIIEIIKKDSSSSKWLIFVTNKQDGENFVHQLGNNTTFITANSKNSKNIDGKIYNEIVTEEKYSCKVLVSTSAMDNGINLKDAHLRNIVLFTTDKTEFLQMLGRKRRTDNEKINLYICARQIPYFNAKLFNLKNQIQAICCYKKNISAFLKQYYIGSISDIELFKGLFYFDSKLNICVNELAEKKIYNDKLFYESIISELSAGMKEAFIIKQLSWIGLEKTYNPCSLVSYVDSDENKAKFFKFLDEHCDNGLSHEQFCEFGEEFKRLVTNAYGKQPGDRPDRNYKETKMRNIFEKYSLKYAIEIKSEIYTLRKSI